MLDLISLKKTIDKLRDFLGPRNNYDSGWFMACSKDDRLLLQLLYILEEHYYSRNKKV